MKVKIDSQYVIPHQDVKNDELMEILDEGVEEPNKFKEGTLRLVLTVSVPNGEIKKLSINKTSKTNLIQALGDETEAWVGKKVRANIVKQQVGKELKDVIILTVPQNQ